MAKITMKEGKSLDAQGRNRALREKAKEARKHPTKAERSLQLALNKGYYRFRHKKPWAGEVVDLWCSVLYLGVQIHPGENELGAEFKGKNTCILHFSEDEVLGEMWAVVQIVQAAARSQEALIRVRRERVEDE